MEKIFDINLTLKKDTSNSTFREKEVTEYHCGIGWWFSVGIGACGILYIDLSCLEEIAQRFPSGFLVEGNVEIDMTIKETLEKGLEEQIAQSDTIFNVRVKITRTFGCRCDSLENFEKPKAFWTDRCLIVEGRKFHVNQRYLAHKSRIFKTLFTDNSSKEITIDKTNPVAFEIFMQVVHKKSPAFPVQLILQIIELAIRFEIGQVKEYCEWYIIEYGVYLWNLFHRTEHDVHNAVMKAVFPEFDFDAYLKKWEIKGSIHHYLRDCDFRDSIQCRSTMEENFRKSVIFVIPVEMTVQRTLNIGGSEPWGFVISGEKEHDFFGLHWTVEVDPQRRECQLKCDEGYWEQDDEDEFHGAPPGWFITVDVDVFEMIGDQKTLVGTKKNGTYASELELVKVDLRSKFDWRSMPTEDAKFEVLVKIVKAAGTRHLTLEDFSKEKEGWTDCCLVVQGRQFHINKKDLARNSAFFANIFHQKPGSVVRQFHVVDEDPDLFKLFLQVAHSGSSFIKKNDIIGLADLATRYKSKMVIDSCKQSLMYYMLNGLEFDRPGLYKIMEHLACATMWEVKVEYADYIGGFLDIHKGSVGHQGLNAMFAKLLELKSKDLCWPVFIDSSSGEVYILMWDLTSTLKSLIKEVAKIENKPISSQKLMIDGVLVKNESDIIAYFQQPLECPKMTNVPDTYKDLIDGTAEELSSELREGFEEFLLDCSEIDVKKRLLLADKHNFQKLLEECFAEITSLQQMNQLIDCYPTMSLPVKRELYKKVVEDRSNEKHMEMSTYKPRRFPLFHVECDSEDTGDSIAKSIGLIRGLPPSQEDVIDFNEDRGIEVIKYNASQVLRIQSINTDGYEE